jgi:gluconokinase
MPASLLPSQLEILEPLEPDEPGFVIDAVGDSEAVVSEIVERLLRSATVDRDRE